MFFHGIIMQRFLALDLDAAERAALITLLSATIAADRFPLSPRIRTLKRVLDKLAPPPSAPQPIPPPKPPGERSAVLGKRGRRQSQNRHSMVMTTAANKMTAPTTTR